MREYLKFYIDGQWVDPVRPNPFEVENPATEQVSGKISLGSAADVDVAVQAARRAFAGWSQSTREQRLDLLQSILAEYQKRADDLAEAVTEEIGAPPSLAAGPQVFLGIGHLTTAIDVLKNFPFSEHKGETLIAKEPIGVCGLITPWNWPINQVAVKVYPALATGCTVVLKPSEVAPYSPYIFAEILAAAGVPAGVFNLVNGDGAGVGAALASHPDIDMVSFTGSTRAGIEVAKNAAPTVKRVTQELGGKSPNIVLDDGGFADGVRAGVANMMPNSGQSCNAPSRMLVPNSRMAEAITIAREEIFGPVLCILGYDDIDQAVEIANDTEYGLAGYVSGADLDKAREVARRIRAGWVTINHAFDMNAPFGGYKRSGNGREWSEFGFHEYLEVKSTLGYAPGKA